MPDDVSEGKSARPALQVIHPVAGPGIFADVVSPRAQIKSHKASDTESAARCRPALTHHEWKAAEQFDLLGISLRSVGSECVGDKMLDQEEPDRNYAAERMQPAQKKDVPLPALAARLRFW